MPSAEQLEGLADEILVATNTCAPVDAFELADEYGLLLTPCSPEDEGFDGIEVRVSTASSHREQHEFVIRCVADVALARTGWCSTAVHVSRLARALMLPRREFSPRSGFAPLLARHINASHAMVGARKGDCAQALPRFTARRPDLRPVWARVH